MADPRDSTAWPSGPRGDHISRVLGHGEITYREARERHAALESLQCPGVVIPHRISVRDNGDVVADSPLVRGPDLSALLRARGPLNLGECVYVGIEIARTLSAMHAAGLAHGDISPANAMVSEGRVVLVDCLEGTRDSEKGTEPYASPERGEGASPAADVYALGQLLRMMVRDSDRDRIEPWIEPMVASNPDARPRAPMVERALGACADPTPLEIPKLSVAQDMRVRAQGPQRATARLESGRTWRLRKAVLQWGTAVVVLVAAAIVTWTVAVPAVMATSTHARHGHAESPKAAITSVEEGAQRVTEARFEALDSGDAEALLATTVEDGPAYHGVIAQARALSAGEVTFVDLGVDVSRVDVISQSRYHATALVGYDVTAHSVRQGQQRERVSGYYQEVELDLLWVDAQWKVDSVRPGP